MVTLTTFVFCLLLASTFSFMLGGIFAREEMKGGENNE